MRRRTDRARHFVARQVLRPQEFSENFWFRTKQDDENTKGSRCHAQDVGTVSCRFIALGAS